MDTFILLTPVERPEDILSASQIATESRKGWNRVFAARAADVVSPDLPEAVQHRRITNLAHSYWCDMVGDN